MRVKRERVSIYELSVSTERWDILIDAVEQGFQDLLGDLITDLLPDDATEAEADERLDLAYTRIGEAAQYVASEIILAALPFLDCPDSLVRDYELESAATTQIYTWLKSHERGTGLMSDLMARAVADDVIAPVVVTRDVTRRAVSKSTRGKVLTEHGHRCGMCHAHESEAVLEIDHRKPWAISRDDSLENLWPLCKPCHKTKTVKDRAAIRRHRTKAVRPPRKVATASTVEEYRSRPTGVEAAPETVGGPENTVPDATVIELQAEAVTSS